jgi:hypothetical protein
MNDDKMVVTYDENHEITFISRPMPQTSAEALAYLVGEKYIIVDRDEGEELQRQREAA